MNWLNLPVHLFRNPDLLEIGSAKFGTWIRVLAYCCEQENHGTICGAAHWTNRRWLQACGVSKRDVATASPLLSLNGNDLQVAYYPGDKQLEVEAKREAGRVGGRRSAEARASKHEASTASPDASSTLPLSAPSTASPSPEAQVEAEHERKGRERKGIGIREEKEKEEGEGAGRPASPAARPKDASEVAGYITEAGLPLAAADASAFFDHYQSNGWKVGRAAMKDWRAAVRNWARRPFSSPGSSGGGAAGPRPKKTPEGGGGAGAPIPFNPGQPDAHTGGMPGFN